MDGSNERSNNGYLIDPDSELERAKNRGRKQGKWHWVGMFIGGVICIGAALIVFSLLAWMCAMSIDLAIHAWRNL